jgi:CubicO group peptidase (beta-lactamase class C family)
MTHPQERAPRARRLIGGGGWPESRRWAARCRRLNNWQRMRTAPRWHMKPAGAAVVDPLIRADLAEFGIPGAAFVFVHDGRIVYQQGYGFSGVASRAKVDPEGTVADRIRHR